MSRYRLIALMLTLLTIIFPTTAQDSHRPYLYYYDNRLHAILVESADGLDQYILADGLIPETISGVMDLSWSPHGEWLAWNSVEYDGGNRRIISSKPQAIRADGQFVPSILEDFPEGRLWWSPTDDLLVVEELVGAGCCDVDALVYRLTLIDPASNTVLVSTEIERLSDWFAGHWIQWTRDGRYLIYAHTIPNPGLDYPIQFEIFDIQNHSVSEFSGEYNLISPLDISPTGLVVYRYEDILEDPTGSNNSHIPDFAPESLLSWSADGRYLLYYQYYDDNYSLMLLDAEQKTIRAIPGIWIGGEFSEADASWSPDGSQAVLRDDGLSLYLLNPQDSSTERLLDFVDGWRWQNNHVLELLTLNQDYERNRILLYELDTRTIIHESQLPQASLGQRFSSDGQYLAGLLNSQEIYTLNLDNGMQMTLPDHASSPGAVEFLGYIEWHPEENWFLTREMPFITMNGPDYWRSSVVYGDALVRRDLNQCLFDPCTQWLPGNVNPEPMPGYTPPPHIQPTAVLHHDRYISGLRWDAESAYLIVLQFPAEYDEVAPAADVWDVVAQTIVGQADATAWEQGQYIESAHGWTLDLGFPDDPQYVSILDARTEEAIFTIAVYGDFASFSPNGEMIVIAKDHDIFLYRTAAIREALENGLVSG